ncbi:28026_t:CDS:2 [Dentiscutata erythropus]|uniref:28026_t:CDS:1 n=1 Tax=Dentiscutata erythropus TaxID=1348616 RepID=A0A9N9FYA0_9GLOM|nr:28026_t:CDS:2 [Dentiscutata erythropus]
MKRTLRVEIFGDNVKLKDLPKTNGGINLIDDIGKTSNNEDVLKNDLEIKMVINNNRSNNVKTVIKVKQAMNEIMISKMVNDEIITRRGSNYAKLIRYDHEAKSGGID